MSRLRIVKHIKITATVGINNKIHLSIRIMTESEQMYQKFGLNLKFCSDQILHAAKNALYLQQFKIQIQLRIGG